jgi:hypothetical protein
LPFYLRRRDGKKKGPIEHDPRKVRLMREAIRMRLGGATIAAVRDYLRKHRVTLSYHGVQSLFSSRRALTTLFETCTGLQHERGGRGTLQRHLRRQLGLVHLFDRPPLLIQGDLRAFDRDLAEFVGSEASQRAVVGMKAHGVERHAVADYLVTALRLNPARRERCLV